MGELKRDIITFGASMYCLGSVVGKAGVGGNRCGGGGGARVFMNGQRFLEGYKVGDTLISSYLPPPPPAYLQ